MLKQILLQLMDQSILDVIGAGSKSSSISITTDGADQSSIC